MKEGTKKRKTSATRRAIRPERGKDVALAASPTWRVAIDVGEGDNVALDVVLRVKLVVDEGDREELRVELCVVVGDIVALGEREGEGRPNARTADPVRAIMTREDERRGAGL
jgi:hypothetical protein